MSHNLYKNSSANYKREFAAKQSTYAQITYARKYKYFKQTFENNDAKNTLGIYRQTDRQKKVDNNETHHERSKVRTEVEQKTDNHVSS